MRRNLEGVPRAVMLLCALAVATGGCKGKQEEAPGGQPPPPRAVTGLSAVPRDATALVGVNVASLRSSWLVRRAVAQMFRRDPGLEERIEQLARACKLDPAADLDSFIIGVSGAPADPDSSGEHEAVMVVTGTFAEADLASCVGQSVAEDGGSLTSQRVDGRTLYRVGQRSGGRDSVWFTVSAPRTLVIATSSSWLARAVGDGDKIADSPSMAALLERVDQDAGIWVAGEIDQRVGAGLVELTAGAVNSPPRAMFGHGRFDAGAGFVLGAVMSSPEDAKYLVSLAKDQLSLGVWAAQRYGLGPLVSKLGVDSEGKTVYLRLSLSEEELRQVLAQIDTPAGSAQNPAEN